MKTQIIRKAVVRVDGKVNKKFKEGMYAAYYARTLVEERGIKRERITCRWEDCPVPKKSEKYPLEILFDVDERDEYKTLPEPFSNEYIKLDISILMNPYENNIYKFVFLKKIDLKTNETRENLALKNVVHLDMLHRTLVLTEKELKDYELTGKILANL